MNTVVCRDVAEADFERFCNRHDLRLQPAKFDAEATQMWADQKEILLEEIMEGKLTVSDDGLLVYQPRSESFKGTTLTFKELSYEFLEETDKYSKEGIHKRNRMLLAYMTGNPNNAAMFYHMGKRDYLVCTAILVVMQGESRPL